MGMGGQSSRKKRQRKTWNMAVAETLIKKGNLAWGVACSKGQDKVEKNSISKRQ